MNSLNNPVVLGKLNDDEKEASQLLNDLPNACAYAKRPKCAFDPYVAAKRTPTLVGATGDAFPRLMQVACDIRKTIATELGPESSARAINVLLSILLLALGMSGCATRPKPNKPQQWGSWSYVPGTASYSARVAEQVKQPKIEEAIRQNIDVAIKALECETNRTWPQEVALTHVKQAQREVGFPIKPIDMGPLLSTNPAVKTKALRNAQKNFRKQDRDLADIRNVTDDASKRGTADTKQNSSVSVTWWKITTALKNFINTHWLALLVIFVSVAFISFKVLPIFFPYLGPIFRTIGHFVGQLFLTTKRLLRKWATKSTQPERADRQSNALNSTLLTEREEIGGS